MNESAESSVGERLRLFREFKKMTQTKLAEEIGGTASGIKQNELGVSVPNGKVLTGLHCLGLNVNWLLSGEGPMLLADLHMAGDAGADDLHAYGECLEILEIALNKLNRTLSPEKKRAAVDNMYRAWKREKKIDPQLLDMITQLAA